MSVDFLSYLDSSVAAAMLGPVTEEMTERRRVEITTNALQWAAGGNFLLIDDIELLTPTMFCSLGIADVIQVEEDPAQSQSTVTFLPSTPLVHNLPGNQLLVGGGAYGFVLSEDSESQIAAELAYHEDAPTPVAVLCPIDEGFCLVLGFRLGSVISTGRVLQSILYNALNTYGVVRLSIHTSSFQVRDAQSPHLHPLQPNDPLLQHIKSSADAFCKAGFNVVGTNLLYSDHNGSYFGRLSLRGSLQSAICAFKSGIRIVQGSSPMVEMSNSPIIPSYASSIFAQVVPMIPTKLCWPSGWAPPQVPYYHIAPHRLAVEDMGADQWTPRSVEESLDATPADRFGLSGLGVRVAVIDTGFSENRPGNTIYPTALGFHPYYEEYHSYTMEHRFVNHAVGGQDPRDDSIGHGTAIVSNLLAISPDVNLHFYPLTDDAADAFAAALTIDPNVISNSWSLSGGKTPESHPELLPLQDLIRQAAENGVIVVFAAGNGAATPPWPGTEPCVVSVGGAYIESDGDLRTSDFAASSDNIELDERLVPDVCGIVGCQPAGLLIEMPTEPDSEYDNDMSTLGDDQTDPNDGWLVASGTSSAAPQVAGLAALVIQQEPGIAVGKFKHLIMTTCTDVITGHSGAGQDVHAKKGSDLATGYGLINVRRALETLIQYTSSNTYEERTLPEGKSVNFYSISTMVGEGYHIDTCGTNQYGFNFFGYLASRDGPVMVRRTGMRIKGWFRQYDTLIQEAWEGRRYVDLYIMSVDGLQILKSVRLLDHNDGTNWKYVDKEITGIGPFDNWGMVRIAIGRRDAWWADWDLTAEWADVSIHSYDDWSPDTIPSGKHINWATSHDADMGNVYHIDTAGSSHYLYNFFAYSDYQPYLGWYYDIHISGWFRQYDTLPQNDWPGRRYIYFYLIDPADMTIIGGKRIIDYYDGTDWVYRRIHFKCGLISGYPLLAIGRRDAWSSDWDLTVEWCNVQLWTYG
ncbi:MAG: S8 family serine peptidase [Candidatus Thorarchaeota archaeon]